MKSYYGADSKRPHDEGTKTMKITFRHERKGKAVVKTGKCECDSFEWSGQHVEEGDILTCSSCGDEFICKWQGMEAEKVYDGNEDETVHDPQTGEVKDKFKDNE